MQPEEEQCVEKQCVGSATRFFGLLPVADFECVLGRALPNPGPCSTVYISVHETGERFILNATNLHAIFNKNDEAAVIQSKRLWSIGEIEQLPYDASATFKACFRYGEHFPTQSTQEDLKITLTR